MKQKKLFIYTRNKQKNSQSYIYISKLIELLHLQDEFLLEVNVYDDNDMGLSNCIGCKNCFNNHGCVLDNIDNFKLIKNKMIASDYIVWSSPVYMHNVTGTMKNFIDRIAYLAHIFALRGKNSMIISSENSSGNEFVVNYLYKVLSSLGSPVTSIALLSSFNNFNDGKLEEHAETILSCLKKPIYSNKLIDEMFLSMQKAILHQSKDLVEYKYWKEYGMFGVNSLSQLIENEKNESNI